MNASSEPLGTTPRPADAYRQLVIRGLAPGEAANLTAIKTGLRLGNAPWTMREISHVLFLRALREDDRFGPNDGAA